MSLIFTVTFEGQEFEVEATPDGDLFFLDHDIQFDRAAREFGYPETAAMRLLILWKYDPISFIGDNLEKDQSSRLSKDFIEHILSVPSSNRAMPLCGLKPILSDALKFGGILAVASRSAHAAGDNASLGEYSKEWWIGFRAEKAWQVRRFFDVMEAIGQNRDWPDLGVTK